MNSTFLRRFTRRLKNAARRTILRVKDRYVSSHGAAGGAQLDLARLMPEAIRFDESNADARAVRHFLRHRFDLLGSGWMVVEYAMECRGVEGSRYDSRSGLIAQEPRGLPGNVNSANREAAGRIRGLIDASYVPIDWQLDFKSGYRWSERTWYRDIRYGAHPGADVKVPWELSRMQHLPELAVAFHRSADPMLPREFCNQVLDWIAQNPPRFGVNWACTMDVGIRVANWLIAFDLLRAGGARFADGFERIFAASIADHAQHIVANLEWAETQRANHYLGDIAGLLHAAAYLPACRRHDTWLLFAAQELIVEAERQFLEDGGHFEASTSYHGLCAEMLAVCAALIAALPRQRIEAALTIQPARVPYGPGLNPDVLQQMLASHAATGLLLPAAFYVKLRRSLGLSRDLMRRDGSTPRIGDDDSGRFVRLGGWIEGGSVAQCRSEYANLDSFTQLPDDELYLWQAPAARQQWLAWGAVVLGIRDTLEEQAASRWPAPLALAQAMVRTPGPGIGGQQIESILSPDDEFELARSTSAPQGEVLHRQSAVRHVGGDLFAEARFVQYPHFGVYIVQSPRLSLVVRCGSAVHDGAGVHAHEDQLGLDLRIDGQNVATDPGTYLYTAAPELRDAYRSSQAHCAPATLGPSPRPVRRVFSRPIHAHGKCHYFGRKGFVGTARVDGGVVRRMLVFLADRVEVHDEYALQPGWLPASADVFAAARPVPFSAAYGVRLK